MKQVHNSMVDIKYDLIDYVYNIRKSYKDYNKIFSSLVSSVGKYLSSYDWNNML